MGLDSNRYAPSILQEDVGTRCFLCDREHIELVRHEVYQGVGRREKCKRLGLWITVCVSCHNNLHADPSGAAARYLDEYAERAALEFYGWTIPKFIREIGKNYIDEVE